MAGTSSSVTGLGSDIHSGLLYICKHVTSTCKIIFLIRQRRENYLLTIVHTVFFYSIGGKSKMISIHKTLVLEKDIHFDIHCITCICIQEVMYSMVSESIVKYLCR